MWYDHLVIIVISLFSDVVDYWLYICFIASKLCLLAWLF